MHFVPTKGMPFQNPVFQNPVLRRLELFPKQSLTDGVLIDLDKRDLGRFAVPFALPGTIFYCNFRYLVILTLSNARRNDKINGTFAF